MADGAEIAELDPILSQRLYDALTSGKEDLFQIITDPSMEVLHAVLKNPLFEENHLLALLKRRDLTEELVKAIHKLPMLSDNHKLKVALVHNPATPAHIAMALLPHLYLFELVDVCYLADVTPDQKVAVERAIIQRLSTTPLGNKITLARRSTTAVVEALLKEGDTRLMEACLANPHLKEAAIFQFLGSSHATPEGISTIARHPRWKGRVNLQLAILKNPKTPAVWYTLFLPHLGTGDLKGLKASRRLTSAQKTLVKEELTRRGHTIS